MAISASQVKNLREITGAGMMDCKKALTETDGDMDAAVEFLRKSGRAKAEKKASRIAAEGLVRVAMDTEQTAAIVEVNSETDFVAKNAEFQTYVEAVARQALSSDACDLKSFLCEAWESDPEKSVQEALVEKIAVIGEKLSIRRFQKISEPDGMIVSYIHGGGRIGVLIKAKTAVRSEAVREALNNLAMQVAALSPKYVSSEDVSEEYKEHEREILLAQAKNENPDKPDAIIEKMIIGRLNKQLKEVCLLEQVYVKAEDGKQTVKNYLAEVSKAAGTNVCISGFVRFETGEGIEKKSENFADEVARQMGL